MRGGHNRVAARLDPIMNVANVVVSNVACKPNWPRLRGRLWRRRPDIAALQKIGSSEPFPEEKLRNAGYESWFLDHNRNWIGVAVLADHDFLRRRDAQLKVLDYGLPDDDREEPRFLTVSIGSLRVSSVYAPYGPKRKCLGKPGAIERRVATDAQYGLKPQSPAIPDTEDTLTMEPPAFFKCSTERLTVLKTP